MFDRNSAEWPMTCSGVWQAQPPRGGIAPLRHDLALARYVEQQAAHRATTASRFDVWSILPGLGLQIVQSVAIAIRGLRALSPERRRAS